MYIDSVSEYFSQACSLCGEEEHLFQIGCSVICKNCLVESLLDNLCDLDTQDAVRLYVVSDPNASDWFSEYFEDSKIAGKWM